MQGFRGLAPPPMLHPLRVEQHEQAERARIGKLARAEPTDTEHCQPAGRCGLIGVGRRKGAPHAPASLKQMFERSGNCDIGNPGEGRRHIIQRPCAGDAGKRDGEQCAPFGRPEPLGGGATVTGAAGRARYLIERALERILGATLGHHAKLGRLARQCTAESGGVAKYAVEEAAGASVAHEGVGERLFCTAECGRRRQPGLAPGARALARGRLGTNLIVLQERQKRHRAPIVLQGLTRRIGKGSGGGAVSG